MPVDNVSWAQVAALLIVSLPGIIAAYFSAKNAASLRTPNGRTVGTMISETHGTSEKAEAGTLPQTPLEPPAGAVTP